MEAGDGGGGEGGRGGGGGPPAPPAAPAAPRPPAVQSYTRLFSRNEDVDRLNVEELGKLPGAWTGALGGARGAAPPCAFAFSRCEGFSVATLNAALHGFFFCS